MLLILLYIFLIEQLLDSITTFMALKSGATELNPLGRRIFEMMGLDCGTIFICILKMLVVLWAAYLLSVFWLGCIVGIMGIVVINNIIVVYRKI